jgi:hypothetical protein
MPVAAVLVATDNKILVEEVVVEVEVPEHQEVLQMRLEVTPEMRVPQQQTQDKAVVVCYHQMEGPQNMVVPVEVQQIMPQQVLMVLVHYLVPVVVVQVVQ